LADARKKAALEFDKKKSALTAKIGAQSQAKLAVALKKADRAVEANRRLKDAFERKQKAILERETLRLEREHRRREAGLRKEVEDRVQRKERGRIQKLSLSLSHRDLKIRELNGQVQTLKRQMEQGTTPQIEGLLYEDQLCSELQKTFREDHVIHTGKGGDILHEVRLGAEKAGLIVYECKKVASFSAAHVAQAREARRTREADYAVLVTNARKKGKSGFFVDGDVLVVHPSGVVSLAGVIRESLLSVAKVRASREQKNTVIKKMLAFLESPEYRNKMADTMRRTEELYSALTEEVQQHVKTWKKRYDHYKVIHANTVSVGSRIEGIMIEKEGREPALLPAGPAYPPEPEVLRLQKKNDEENKPL
jgi:hypothetical protein